MNLYECLEKYKELTLQLIENTKSDKDLNLLIDKRGAILKEIEQMNCGKDEVEKVILSLNIMELENELYNLVLKEKNKAKGQFDNIKRLRMANKNYNSTPGGPQIFSTKL